MILGNTSKFPSNLTPLLLCILGLGAATHLANRVFVPDANAVVMPIVFLLNGLGYVMIARIDQALCHARRPATPLPVLRAPPGGLDGRRRGRLRAHPRRRPAVPGPRPLPLPAPGGGRHPAAAAPRPRDRPEHPGCPAVDPGRIVRVPAGGDRQDRPLHLLRLLLRREARAPDDPDGSARQPAGPRPPPDGPDRPGLGLRHPGDEPRARHRVLGAAVHPVHRPAVGDHRAAPATWCSDSSCSASAPT